jgi:chromosome segregation ATPase
MITYSYYDIDVNRTDKFITDEINKVKKNWLKSDEKKLKELKIQLNKFEKEKEIAIDKCNKLYNKCIKIDKQIQIINKKYTYIKKVRVKNENYREMEYEPI